MFTGFANKFHVVIVLIGHFYLTGNYRHHHLLILEEMHEPFVEIFP
jgi:hypothetical protein